MKSWEERGLIRAIPLTRSVRPVRAEELASVPAGVFTGFAQLAEDDDAVRVRHARSFE